MKRLFAKLAMAGKWRLCFVSVLLSASSAVIGMPHPRLQQQNTHDRPLRVTLRNHKCVSVPRGATFEHSNCAYINPNSGHNSAIAIGDFCTGGCYKGTSDEGFKVCKPQQDSSCSAEYKEVRVKITHVANCVEEERRNSCKCGEWRRLKRPLDGELVVPRCD